MCFYYEMILNTVRFLFMEGCTSLDTPIKTLEHVANSSTSFWAVEFRIEAKAAGFRACDSTTHSSVKPRRGCFLQKVRLFPDSGELIQQSRQTGQLQRPRTVQGFPASIPWRIFGSWRKRAARDCLGAMCERAWKPSTTGWLAQ